MTEEKRTANRCKVCDHPYVDDINDWIKKGFSYRTMKGLLARQAPHMTLPSEPTISRHRQHLTLGPAPSAVDPVQQLEEVNLPEVTPISVSDALQAIIRAGLRTIKERPDRVGVRELIEALKLLNQLGGDDRNTKAYDHAWQELAALRSGEVAQQQQTTRVTKKVVYEVEQTTQETVHTEDDGPEEVSTILDVEEGVVPERTLVEPQFGSDGWPVVKEVVYGSAG